MTDTSVFLQTFGQSPILKIVDYLILNDEFDHSMTNIAKYSEVGYSTLKMLWNDLEESGIIRMTRQVGKAKMFSLNSENPVVVKLKALYWETTKAKVRSKLKKKVKQKTISN